MRFRRGLRAALASSAAFLVAGVSCSAPSKGALVLAISTDMQTPKDLNVVSVYVTTNGTPKFDYLGAIQPDGSVALPATLALVEPDTADAELRIRVIGFQNANARVLRDVLTTVPHQRTALLRLPLSFLDDGSGSGTIPANLLPIGSDAAPEGDTTFDPTQVMSKCDFDKQQTSINGVCASAIVDSSMLETFDTNDVYGDGGLTSSGAPTSCFDVATCFQGATSPANLDTQACTFPLPAGADFNRLNIALVTPGTGACVAPGQCYVPLVNDASDGWSLQGDIVRMPSGVCAKLGEGATLAVSSGTCPTQTTSDPVCEPTGADAGGLPADATVQVDEGPPDGGPLPGDASAVREGSASTDAGSSQDAGACGSVAGGAGGACNQVTNFATVVTPVCSTANPSSPTGGSIADGTYVLTSVTDFGCPDGGPPIPLAETVVVAGGCLEFAIAEEDGGVTASLNYVASIQGAQLTTTEVCPTPMPAVPVSFTATATSIEILTNLAGGDLELDVYTLAP